MSRYIRADDLKKEMDELEGWFKDLKWKVENLDADVVEVVRCEKCTYGYIDPNNFHGYCRKRRDMIYANDFCSKGERIDE